MGLVYAARDVELDRVVAVKVLELARVAPENRRELARRMRREAQAMARIRHPRVVAVYEAGAQDEVAYIVMEHVEGASLDRWIEDGERSVDAVLDVLADAGRGLAAAHAEGLVHRDFKRENVLVNAEGRAQVGDFGLVRALEPEEHSGALRTALTQPGAVVGTVATMSPEQLRGELLDAASDQFSFAVTAWEALYRQSPFTSGTLADRLGDLTHARLREPPADTAVSAAVHRVLLRGLAVDPAHRFASMEALVAALDAARAAPARGALVGGRYRVLELLGLGASGVVHRARDEQDDREVAIKLMLPDPRARRRAAEEARAATLLDDPGIVRVLAVDEDEGYVVMELVGGRSLRQRLRDGALDPREALRIVASVARTLAVAHDAGLAHRDVKPDNVMLREDGRTVVLDLGGLAAATHEASSGGTPAYMAPEQVRGEAAGPAADQFALGVTAYELLAGRSPWRGSRTATLAQILELDPPPCSGDAPLAAVIGRAMAKAIDDRYPDMRAFADAIEDALPRAGPPSRRGRWLWLLAPMAGLAAVAGLAVLLWPAARTRDTPSAPASPLLDEGSVIACPILDARGVDEPNGWLGAAAADLVCRRAQWTLGGRLDRVRMPGHLLGLPRRPSDSMPVDPYAAPDARERSLAAAREHEAWLDGRVTREPERFVVQLAMHTPAALVARAEGADPTLSGAVERAMDGLAGHVPRRARLDPDVARFLGTDDAELALRVNRMRLDASVLDPDGVCRELVGRDPVVAPDATVSCHGAQASLGTPAVLLDRSSPAALARSAPLYLLAHPEADGRAIAEELRAARAIEPSLVGRVQLAVAEGRAFAAAGDVVRAQRALLAAARLAPHDQSIWQVLTVISGGDTGTAINSRTFAAWVPSDCAAWDSMSRPQNLASTDDVTKFQRRAYELAPSVPLIGVDLARRYLRSGRLQDARTVAADLAARGTSCALATELVASLVDASEARFGRALDRLLAVLSTWALFGDGSSGDVTALDFAILLGDLLGRGREVGDAMAARFVLAEPHRLHPTFHGGDETMIGACQRARPDIAERCLERMATVPRAGLGPPSRDDARLREGALRYVRGDLEGAVDAWRPLVPLHVYRLPADAFDRAGETEIARQLDAPRLSRAGSFGGIDPAHAREAQRAAARGDVARARELARVVVAAWSTADAPIPVLAEMRRLAALP